MTVLSHKIKFNNLPTGVKAYLKSDVPMLEMKKSFAIFEVDSPLSKNIAKEVGLMYVGDINIKQLPELIKHNTSTDERISYGIAYEINKRIFNKFPDYFKNSTELLRQWEQLKSAPLISEDEAWKKVLEIEPWILEIEKEEQEEKKKAKETQKRKASAIANLTLSHALQKYPRLGEQLIGANQIKLKILPTPVRPSIKNWITDYHSVLGAGEHGTMERGNYLYHSDNSKQLTPGERQKLAVILKSLDENEAVSVDTEKQEIIFNLQPTTDNLQQKEQPRFGFLGKREIPESRFTVTKQVSDSMLPHPPIPSPREGRGWREAPGEGMSFSSPQKFSRPAPPPPPAPPLPPRNEPRIEGNVVDLKNL